MIQMSRHLERGAVTALLVTALAGLLAAGPLTTRDHYFVRDGKPFFWLGDTAWTIFNLYSPAEAEEYLEHRARQGFTVENVMMVFTGGPGMSPESKNTTGELPFLNWNPATPNEKFFRNVDRVLAIAASKNLILAIMPCGGSSGAYVKKQKIFTAQNVRQYGRWLGRRYKDAPNLIWVNGFDLKTTEHVDITEALAAGLREGDTGHHLITFHPGGGNSSSFFHTEDWLSYNTIQTWSDYWRIHPLVMADYDRLPVKPVVLAEGAYEAGPEYPSRPITPLIVRKQAWWAYLGGGFHTYGHNDMWRRNPTWRSSLDAPGARQMGVLRRVLEPREWWMLVPDQSVIAVGANSDKNLNVSALSTRGDRAIIYFASRNALTIDFGKITSSQKVRLTWINPETGEASHGGEFESAGLHPLTPALKSEDAALILEAVR
ncbi:MAG: DUF4038 domain-containing protein [Bryobacteraceae bacterium]